MKKEVTYSFHTVAWKKILLLGLLVCCFAMSAPNAWAGSCSDSSVFNNVYTAGAGSLGDDVGKAASSYTGIVGIFSMVLDYFRNTIGSIMTQMYCGFQGALTESIETAILLLFVVFGFAILSGIAPFNLKEAATLMFKFGLVWGFALNADWAIGIGYRFFMGLAEEGSDIVLSAICGGNNVPHLSQPDTLFSSLFVLVAGGGGIGAAFTPPEGCLENNAGGLGLSNAVAAATISPDCSDFFMTALASMVLMSPSILSFAGMLVIEYITLYVRALVGYLASVVFISFLFIISPLFISFALFRTTFHLFSKWLQYLTSFSVQMMLIFAFLGLVTAVSAQLIATFYQFLAMFKPYDVTLANYNIHVPMTVCSICQYTLTPAGAGGGMPTAQCGGGGSGGNDDSIQGSNGDKVIPLTNLYLHPDLMAFIMAETVAWWLIAFVLNEFMQKAPEYARKLAGAPMAAGLGGYMPVFQSLYPNTKTQPGQINYGLDNLRDAAAGGMQKAIDTVARPAATIGLGLGIKGMMNRAQSHLSAAGGAGHAELPGGYNFADATGGGEAASPASGEESGKGILGKSFGTGLANREIGTGLADKKMALISQEAILKPLRMATVSPFLGTAGQTPTGAPPPPDDASSGSSGGDESSPSANDATSSATSSGSSGGKKGGGSKAKAKEAEEAKQQALARATPLQAQADHLEEIIDKCQAATSSSAVCMNLTPERQLALNNKLMNLKGRAHHIAGIGSEGEMQILASQILQIEKEVLGSA